MGGDHSLKIAAPKLLRFGIDSVLKILNERITYWMNEWINDEGVYRTALATPGLLITMTITQIYVVLQSYIWKDKYKNMNVYIYNLNQNGYILY